MRYKAFGLLFGKLLFKVGNVTVVLRGIAAFALKQYAEGPKAFKTYTVANFGNANAFLFKQQLCFFQPFPGKVLVGRFAVNGGKQPVKMVWRKVRLAAYTRKVKIFVKVIVNVHFGTYHSFIYVCCKSHNQM